MINIGELRDLLTNIENEYGSDCNIVLQLYDNDKLLRYSDYCLDTLFIANGTLFLTNKKSNNKCI